jgi:ATP-binding cassette subfamily C protein
MEIIRAFVELLTPRERRNLYLLFVAVLVMAGLEVVSVASIMPFLSVAAEPGSVHENAYLSWAYHTFEFENTNTFLVALGIGAFSALVLSNSFIVFTTWALQRYIWGRNHSLSRRLLKSYIFRPYEYFLTRNSSELGKNVLDEVKEVVNLTLLPSLRGVAKGVVAISIIGFLVFVDPIVAVVVSTVLGLSYLSIYLAVRKRLGDIGDRRVEAQAERYRFVNEALGGVKEVKIRGKEQSILNQYDNPSQKYAKTQTQYRVIRKAPRYILEAIAFGGIILIAVYLISFQGNIQKVIPMLGLYAFAGYRLMPALQHAFRGLASARYNSAALETLRRDMMEGVDQIKASVNQKKEKTRGGGMALNDRLLLDTVSFTYPDAEEPAIKDLSLEVPARTTVGFVGKTGSGKTTTVDIILGLLRPQQGELTVDGKELRKDNVGEWQRNIGYVPQQIYLVDDTVARNIAFGVPEEEIDMEAVRDAARRAHIYDFIANDLTDRWGTMVGEKGVKLSGGQRQRVGIARALYHKPSVLVLDEATSALDQETEARVMEAIYELEDDHTMLMIAHRLSTVRRADSIVMLERGRKVGEGSYEELADEHSKFQSMAFS